MRSDKRQDLVVFNELRERIGFDGYHDLPKRYQSTDRKI